MNLTVFGATGGVGREVLAPGVRRMSSASAPAEVPLKSGLLKMGGARLERATSCL